jgi:hypothetical protein
MVLRTSTWPSPGIGASVSTKSKSLSLIAPSGRRASSYWRFFMAYPPMSELNDLHSTGWFGGAFPDAITRKVARGH